MNEKNRVGAPNQPKTKEVWLKHYGKFTSLLRKVEKDNVLNMIEELKECESTESGSEDQVKKLNKLRTKKPYDKVWPAWTKRISNSTKGKETKVECSQYDVQFIDKIKQCARLGSRKNSLNFIINSYRPIVKSLIASGNIDALTEEINSSETLIDFQDQQIEELQSELSILRKQVVALQNEISACPDTTHGIEFDE